MHYETEGRRAAIRRGNPRSKDSSDEAKCRGIGNDKESEGRDDRNDKLVLLFLTLASTSTVFK